MIKQEPILTKTHITRIDPERIVMKVIEIGKGKRRKGGRLRKNLDGKNKRSRNKKRNISERNEDPSTTPRRMKQLNKGNSKEEKDYEEEEIKYT